MRTKPTAAPVQVEQGDSDEELEGEESTASEGEEQGGESIRLQKRAPPASAATGAACAPSRSRR